MFALGAREIVDREAAVGGLAQQRNLLQVEQSVGAAADGERALVLLRGELVLVLRGVHGAEPGERHHEPPRGDALRSDSSRSSDLL